MSGKSADICRRKSRRFAPISKSTTRARCDIQYSVYTKLYTKWHVIVKAINCILNTKKVRNQCGNHSSFFASNWSKKAGILHGVLFASGETPLCLDLQRQLASTNQVINALTQTVQKLQIFRSVNDAILDKAQKPLNASETVASIRCSSVPEMIIFLPIERYIPHRCNR